MPITTIKLAVSQAEREAVYRFRYGIYVEEMQRKQIYADHIEKRIEDPLDRNGYTIAAWKDGLVVATVRNNHLNDAATDHYCNFYQACGNTQNHKIAITTRLMVAPSHRCSMLATRVCIALYKEALSRGVERAYLDCNAHLVKYFQGLGYRIHRDRVEHEEYGAVTVMHLNLLDLNYLQRIRSPFRRACKEFLDLHR